MKYKGYFIRWNIKQHKLMIQDGGRTIALADTMEQAKAIIDRELTP